MRTVQEILDEIQDLEGGLRKLLDGIRNNPSAAARRAFATSAEKLLVRYAGLLRELDDAMAPSANT